MIVRLVGVREVPGEELEDHLVYGIEQVDRAGAKSAGIDDFLPKPFSSLQLLAKVRDYVPDALAG